MQSDLRGRLVRWAAVTAVVMFASAVPGRVARADAPAAVGSDPYSLRPSVMLGVMQWTLFGGGNIAAQVKYKRLVAEYSHGQGLRYHRFASLTQTEAERDAGVEVESPWTTGGGFGFQITPRLHLLVEAKAHRYLVRDAFGDAVEYTTFTVGPGLFYDIYLTKRLFVQPNLRWWPTIADTHDGDRELMAADGTVYRHARHDLPPFVNVNLGWTFDAR
jgi:hypothetical protein